MNKTKELILHVYEASKTKRDVGTRSPIILPTKVLDQNKIISDPLESKETHQRTLSAQLDQRGAGC